MVYFAQNAILYAILSLQNVHTVNLNSSIDLIYSWHTQLPSI